MLPILFPGYAMICFVEVSKGVISHSPIGFGRVSKLIMCLTTEGNVKTDILSIVTTIILSQKV